MQAPSSGSSQQAGIYVSLAESREYLHFFIGLILEIVIARKLVNICP